MASRRRRAQGFALLSCISEWKFLRAKKPIADSALRSHESLESTTPPTAGGAQNYISNGTARVPHQVQESLGQVARLCHWRRLSWFSLKIIIDGMVHLGPCGPDGLTWRDFPTVSYCELACLQNSESGPLAGKRKKSWGFSEPNFLGLKFEELRNALKDSLGGRSSVWPQCVEGSLPIICWRYSGVFSKSGHSELSVRSQRVSVPFHDEHFS